MTNEKGDLFNETNEVQNNWFKFEKIGDTIQGILLSTTEREPEGVYPGQMVYELETNEGVINVPISVNKVWVISAMKRAKLGQLVGFKYDSDFQSDEMKKNKLQPAKTIKVFMDKSFNPMQEVLSSFNPAEEEMPPTKEQISKEPLPEIK